jgi:hypothetical protein
VVKAQGSVLRRSILFCRKAEVRRGAVLVAVLPMASALLAGQAPASSTPAQAPTAAAAQPTVTLDHIAYGQSGNIVVTVTLAGQTPPVARPRWQFVKDATPLPPPNPGAWTELPAITATRQIMLQAPEDIGRWRLVLNDGSQPLASVPFEVLDWMAMLEQTRARLEAELKASPPLSAAGVPPPAPQTAPTPGPTTADAPGGTSARGLIQFASSAPVNLADVFDVVVTLPADAGTATEPAVLRWGYTVGLSWDEKAKAPSSMDFPNDVTLRNQTTQRVSVIAPFDRAGQYELRLFRGTTLVDVLTVNVK